MARLSKNQINLLGNRLRVGRAADDDLALLADYRDQHLPVLADVLHRLSNLREASGSVFTARQKNVGTIIDKLQREEGMQLARMRDVAGARLVIPFGSTRPGAQDAIVGGVCREFPGAKVVDRRLSPSFGYRAVHVEVESQGLHAEIQIRTFFQDAWAQLSERIGDLWGRQTRYGQPPNDNAKPIIYKGVEVPPTEIVNELKQLSELIDRFEKLHTQAFTVSLERGLLQSLLMGGALALAMWQASKDVREMFKALGQVMPSEHTGIHLRRAREASMTGHPYYVVSYRRSTGSVEHLEPFGEDQLSEMLEFRSALEAKHVDDRDDVEVVLLATRSDQGLLKTHSRYFRNAAELAEAGASRFRK